MRADTGTGGSEQVTARGSDRATIEIVVARLVAEHDIIRSSAALLSSGERERANAFAFDRHRRQFVLARVRLRQLLGQRLGVPPESVELVTGRHGKPALAPRPAGPDLRFNVSHCDDLAVYVFSTGRDVGIDVEAIRVMRDADMIADGFFSRYERDAYRALDPRDKPVGFFNCWTRKEAFIKALGEGFAYPLDGFDVSLVPGEAAKLLRVENTPGDDCGWSMESFAPAPGFVAAVVARRNGTTGQSR